MKIQWRKNVLALVGTGYALTFFVFLMLLFKGGMAVEEAYNVVNGPLMALIGGSLAIAKDLINADDASQAEQNSAQHQNVGQDKKSTDIQDGE